MLSRTALVVLCCLLSLPPHPAQAAEGPLTWGLQDWPGLVDTRDQQPVGGIMFELLRQLTEQMPEYRHRYQLMSLQRGFELLRRGHELCVVGAFRTPERDLLGHYVGLFIAMPYQLVIRAEDLPRITQGQADVSLQALLQREDLRGALVRGRSYGPLLDPLLGGPQAAARLPRVPSLSVGTNLFEMLAHERIDYMIEHAEIYQHLQLARRFSTPLRLVPIRETPQPLIAGIYCSRNTWGERIIRRLDGLARDPAIAARFAEAQQQSVPQETLQHYRLWIERYSRERPTQSQTNLP